MNEKRHSAHSCLLCSLFIFGQFGNIEIVFETYTNLPDNKEGTVEFMGWRTKTVRLYISYSLSDVIILLMEFPPEFLFNAILYNNYFY